MSQILNLNVSNPVNCPFCNEFTTRCSANNTLKCPSYPDGKAGDLVANAECPLKNGIVTVRSKPNE